MPKKAPKPAKKLGLRRPTGEPLRNLWEPRNLCWPCPTVVPWGTQPVQSASRQGYSACCAACCLLAQSPSSVPSSRRQTPLSTRQCVGPTRNKDTRRVWTKPPRLGINNSYKNVLQQTPCCSVRSQISHDMNAQHQPTRLISTF